MSMTPTQSEDLVPPQGRPLTGRMVLLWLIAFFGIIFAANGIMMHFAVSTFGGIDEANAYANGLSYDRQIRDEQAQEARGWRVDLSAQRKAQMLSEFSITQQDKAGVATSGLDVVLYLEHPADRRRDQRLVLIETSPGHYSQSATIDAGRWDAITEITHNGQQMFRSRNRIMIDGPGAGAQKP